MPVVTNVGKADLALASGVSGVLKAAGGTLAGAVANTDYTPPDSPTIANTITQATAAPFGFLRRITNTAPDAATTAPWGESYEGYFDPASGETDNVYMDGLLRNLKVPGQPAVWRQRESKWVPGGPPNGWYEDHDNYVSIDGSVEYRPRASIIDLNTHVHAITMHNLGYWKLYGIGTGIGDPGPPLLQWDGITGQLVGGAFLGSSFSGDGSALTNLSADDLASGTIADARFPLYLTVDSGNLQFGVHTATMADPYGGNDWFKVGGSTGQTLGYQGSWISFVDGDKQGVWSPDVIGTRSNHPFIIRVNNNDVYTFNADGSVSGFGSISGESATLSGNLTANNGSVPAMLGAAAGSGGFPGLWLGTAPTTSPTTANYSVLSNTAGTETYVNATDGVELRVANAEKLKANATGLGFFGVEPVGQQSGEITTGLVALGLFSSVTIAQSSITGLTSALAAKAPTASPTFSGTASFNGMVNATQPLTALRGLFGNTASDLLSIVPLVVSQTGTFAVAYQYSSGAADAKIWDTLLTANTLDYRAVNDAYSAATSWLRVVRSGQSIASIAFPATAPVSFGGPIATGSGVTGSRPTATVVGTQWYDTTLSKPIWWDGSVWKDATGTTV